MTIHPFKRKKHFNQNATKKHIILCKDIIKYIVSEFLFNEDALNMMCCNSHFNVKPYRLNFVSNKNIDTKKVSNLDFIEMCYFECFELCVLSLILKTSKKIHIQTLKTNNSFNEPIENYFDHFENICVECIELGDCYNQNMPEKLPNNLKKIKCGFCYNKPLLETLPDTVSTIIVSDSYDHPFPKKFPSNLKRLILNGSSFNHEIIHRLPSGLKHFRLGFDSNKSLDNILPDSLEILELGYSYNQKLPDPLPICLSVLKSGECFNQSLPKNMSENLREIWLGDRYKQPLPHPLYLPKSLKCIYMCKKNVNHILGTMYTLIGQMLHYDNEYDLFDEEQNVIDFYNMNTRIEFV